MTFLVDATGTCLLGSLLVTWTGGHVLESDTLGSNVLSGTLGAGVLTIGGVKGLLWCTLGSAGHYGFAVLDNAGRFDLFFRIVTNSSRAFLVLFPADKVGMVLFGGSVKMVMMSSAACCR